MNLTLKPKMDAPYQEININKIMAWNSEYNWDFYNKIF
jgi:hypothetical protein